MSVVQKGCALLNEGISLRTAHFCVRSTQKYTLSAQSVFATYTHIDNEALRVAAKANPLSRVKIKGKIKEEPDKNHEKDEEA